MNYTCSMQRPCSSETHRYNLFNGMQNGNARNNDLPVAIRNKDESRYKPSETVAGQQASILSRGSLTEGSIGVTSVRRARSPPRERERYNTIHVTVRARARERKKKIKRNIGNGPLLEAKGESRTENSISLGQVSIPQSRPADRSRASNTNLPPTPIPSSLPPPLPPPPPISASSVLMVNLHSANYEMDPGVTRGINLLAAAPNVPVLKIQPSSNR